MSKPLPYLTIAQVAERRAATIQLRPATMAEAQAKSNGGAA